MKVVGVGSSNFDQLMHVRSMPGSGEHPEVLRTSWQYGGPVSTAMAAASRLGQPAAMVAAVGGVLGEYIASDLIRQGVDCSGLVDVPGTQSPMYICVSDGERGGRSFWQLQSPSVTPLIKPEQLHKEKLISFDWLLIGGEDGASLLAAQWFREAGKVVAVDADGSVQQVGALLALSNHFIMSEDLYRREAGPGDWEQNLRALHARQPQGAVTIATFGAKGEALIDERGNFFRLPAYPVEAVDTTGAGDVFHGAYIAARMEGLSAPIACRLASAASAIKCKYMGGRAGLPTREQVRAFMESGKWDFDELKAREAYYAAAAFMRG